MTDFTGHWLTTYGPMDLHAEGRRLRGAYRCDNADCAIEGEVQDGRFVFTYQEPTVQGEGWFQPTRRGRAFTGRFRPSPEHPWQPWEGERPGFDGLWNTTFGLLRLVEDGDRVHGYYTVDGGSVLEGRLKGHRLVFRYKEKKAKGRGRFELADHGLSFSGQWQPKGADGPQPWWGHRVRPQPGVAWLIVLEAPWQRLLAEQEYAFGHMLRAFFARLPHVQVRHRFFPNDAALRQLLRELAFIAEPVYLVLATHGGPEGAHVNGTSIPMAAVLDGLRAAGDLRLVHFSACLMMQDPAVRAAIQAFADEHLLPFSGYKTSVNWAASAIIEFTLLELVLLHGREPHDAARQVAQLLPFSTDAGVPDGAFRPAGFTLVAPHTAPATSRKPRSSKPRPRPAPRTAGGTPRAART